MIILIEILMGLLIMSYISDAVISNSDALSLVTSKAEISKENENLNEVKQSILNYYEKNGVLPTTFNDVKYYSSVNTININKDRFNQDFELLKNSDNSPFLYDNSSNSFLIAAISKGGDGVLDSKLESNYLLLEPTEKAIIISSNDFLKSKRSISKTMVNKCNQAYIAYLNLNTNHDPLSIYDLVSTHILQPYELFDGYGNTLNIDQSTNTCYSFGINMIDDAKSNDDIN